MGIRSRNKVQVGFSVSSMTDIVFLLLIFFILVSTLVTTNSLNLILPQTGKPNDGIDPPIVKVVVTEEGQFFVDDKLVAANAIENTLISKMEGANMNGIVLKSDPEAPTEQVVSVMDIADKNEYKIVLTMEKQ